MLSVDRTTQGTDTTTEIECYKLLSPSASGAVTSHGEVLDYGILSHDVTHLV